MKKKLSFLLCLVLTLAMTFAMVGCGETEKDDDKGTNKKKAESVVGTWETEVDMLDFLLDEIGDDEAGNYIDMDEFVIKMSVEMDKDGKYAVSVDKDAFEDQLVTMMKGMMENMMQAAANEAGVTLDEFMSAAGMTMDELVESALAEADMDTLMADFEDETGTYEYKDGKLVFDGEDEWTIEFDGASKFEVTAMEGEDEEMSALLPIVFTKK